MCGVLMNIVVLEPDLVRSDLVFREITDFFMGNVIMIGKYLLQTLLSRNFKIQILVPEIPKYRNSKVHRP